MQRVFVYGTLKKGYCRHDALSSAKFLGAATTEPLYRLFDLGSYPGMVCDKNGAAVEGELYEVDDECLKNLDMVEGVSEGFYSRENVQLISPWNDQDALTYIYRKSIDGHPQIVRWPS